MLKPGQVSTGHTACIHYIAHDYYGKRIATCSSDKTIRVFDKDDDDQWRLISPPFGGSGSGHRSAIWKFGYPGNSEFKIKFEVETENGHDFETEDSHSASSNTYGLSKSSQQHSVCPKSLGIAIGFSLQRWKGCRSKKDGRQFSEPDDRFEYIKGILQISTSGRSQTSSTSMELDCLPTLLALGDCHCDVSFESHKRAYSWNKNRVEQPMLAVGCWRPASNQSDSSRQLHTSASIWGYCNEQQRWQMITKMDIEPDKRGERGEVRDIDWAPNMGRPMHLLAAAIGCSVQVWRLPLFTGWSSASGDFILLDRLFLTCDRGSHRKHGQAFGAANPARGREVQDAVSWRRAVDLRYSGIVMPYWRVGWNLTGTTLAASAENGQVKVWKLDFQGQLKLHQTLDPH
eukprot:762781-Hanusia_phi.AAC.16